MSNQARGLQAILLRLNLTAGAAFTDDTHQEIAEAIVQSLDVSEHPHGRMVRNGGRGASTSIRSLPLAWRSPLHPSPLGLVRPSEKCPEEPGFGNVACECPLFNLPAAAIRRRIRQLGVESRPSLPSFWGSPLVADPSP